MLQSGWLQRVGHNLVAEQQQRERERERERDLILPLSVSQWHVDLHPTLGSQAVHTHTDTSMYTHTHLLLCASLYFSSLNSHNNPLKLVLLSPAPIVQMTKVRLWG